MKLNSYDVPSEIEGLTRQQISMLLGTNGEPKYNASQLKSTKRERLIEELQALIAVEIDRLAITKPKKRGRKATGCTTLASAKVKKSKLIRDVFAGKITYDEANNIIHNDTLLLSICGDFEMFYITGTKPKRGRPRKVGN